MTATTIGADVFIRHDIDHLSASSLNLWAAEPALWAMERLLGLRGPQSAIAARGKAVEHGVDIGLRQPDASPTDCIAAAQSEFDRLMALAGDPRREDERKAISGYVSHALVELRQYGVPSAYPERVEIALDGVPVPVIGYVDWLYDRHGLIVDLKTSERLPGSISAHHGRQGAVYATARGNHAMRFAYAKPSPGKKDGRAVTVYELSADDVRRHLSALTQIALRLQRFLALSADPGELAGLLVPDYDSFYWNNPVARGHGAQVYGF